MFDGDGEGDDVASGCSWIVGGSEVFWLLLLLCEGVVVVVGVTAGVLVVSASSSSLSLS